MPIGTSMAQLRYSHDIAVGQQWDSSGTTVVQPWESQPWYSHGRAMGQPWDSHATSMGQQCGSSGSAVVQHSTVMIQHWAAGGQHSGGTVVVQPCGSGGMTFIRVNN